MKCDVLLNENVAMRQPALPAFAPRRLGFVPKALAPSRPEGININLLEAEKNG